MQGPKFLFFVRIAVLIVIIISMSSIRAVHVFSPIFNQEVAQGKLNSRKKGPKNTRFSVSIRLKLGKITRKDLL